MTSRRSGFTLLEVMVATLIMGIAVVGLIVGLTQSVKNASRLGRLRPRRHAGPHPDE